MIVHTDKFIESGIFSQIGGSNSMNVLFSPRGQCH